MTNIEKVIEAIKTSGDPDELINGMSPLHISIHSESRDLIFFLLENGADPCAPNCQLPPPIHYAITLNKNESLSALLDGRVDPNMKTTNGNVPLITAIKSKNKTAVKMLLEYNADPNITNNNGEIPLFHAIFMGDDFSTALLLEYRSKITVGKKSGLHFAIRQNQPECVRLILANNGDRNEKDPNGKTPLDLALGLEDPTIELLLYLPEIPSSVWTYNFVKYLNDAFESTEIENIRDIMIESPNHVPHDIHEFIHRIITAERCHHRFVNFLERRIVDYNNVIECLSTPTKEITNRDIERLSKQLRNSFIKKIGESKDIQEKYSDTFLSDIALRQYSTWIKWCDDLQSFIDDVVARGIQKYGIRDEYVMTLEKSKKNVIKVQKLLENVKAKTCPFQIEIVDFISATVKKLKELKVDGLDKIETHFKLLIRQIEKTNPQLIELRFKKAK